MNRQTYLAKNDEVKQDWYHVDATDLVMGRLSAKLATVLMGKHKPEYTPHTDTGDFVVVTNASKLKITGSKGDTRFFRRFSGYPSGQSLRSYNYMLANQPDLLLERAVRRMLPKNKLGQQMLKKLKVYAGESHPHQAQTPKPLSM
jgi:large subunit ribosomal protein L13